MGVLEICAVVLALIYVILAIFQRRLCWIAAIASASLYILIFWQVRLYLEAALQVSASVDTAAGALAALAAVQEMHSTCSLSRRPSRSCTC